MNKTCKIVGIMIIFFLMLSIKVNAASAKLSVDKSSVNVGDTITATVTYTAAAWDLKISSDSGLTTSSTTRYADSSESAENVTKKIKVVYKATKTGDFKIYLSGNVTDESKNKSDPVNDSKSITVKEKTTNNNTTSNNNPTTTTKKSSNAYLKTLGVTPKQYDFTGFKKTKTDYSVTVPSNVNSLSVVAKAEDPKATVKVSGNTGFDTGSNNKIKIVVTAEDGKTKTYNIKVTKLATEEEKPGNIIEEGTTTNPEEELELFLESLEIEGLVLSPAFAKDEYSYTATLTDANITELKVNAKPNNKNAQIEITGNTALIDGENIINVMVKLEGNPNQKVYQIKVNKEANANLLLPSQNDEKMLDKIMNNWKSYVKIIIIILFVIILAIVVLIILLRKENKRLDGEEEYTKEKTKKSKHF